MTAAMYAGRSMLKTVVLERGASGGELLNTEIIEDYPGFEHIEGWELAQKFESHAKKFGAEFEVETVITLEKMPDGMFHATTDNGTVYRSKTAIITSGGTPIKLGVPGEIEYAGKGVSYCAICDGAFFKGHTIAVIGGGDAAVEDALCREGLSDPPAHGVSRFEDSSEAPVRESKDRSHLEHCGR
jgi:thioredoxin reductase (NADPH)